MLFTKIIEKVQNRVHDGVEILLNRTNRRGRVYTQERIRMGPNMVHAFITHADGSITDLGLSHNLLTNIGRDVWADWIGGVTPAGGGAGPATATSATSITGTGSVWTASNLATPQLGLVGKRVYASVTGVTTAPVYGNIVSNTTNVATIDKWWASDDTTGTTPASTNGFIIGRGGLASLRFMGLTTDSGAASASDLTLTSEITTNGGARAVATYAHTYGTNSLTLAKTFSITGTLTAIHKMGLFCTLSAAGADPVVFEAALNADATVVNGDSLTVTDSITLTG